MNKDDSKKARVIKPCLTNEELGDLKKTAQIAEVSLAQYVEDLIRATLEGRLTKR